MLDKLPEDQVTRLTAHHLSNQTKDWQRARKAVVKRAIRRLGVDQPEANLWRAVFCQAVDELHKCAGYFFSADFRHQAEVCGIEPGAVTGYLRRARLIPEV